MLFVDVSRDSMQKQIQINVIIKMLNSVHLIKLAKGFVLLTFGLLTSMFVVKLYSLFNIVSLLA